MRCAALTGVGLLVGVSSCALPVTKARQDEARQQIIHTYECVRYHYIDGDEQRGIRLIDEASTIARRARIDSLELLELLGDAQIHQAARIEPRAREIDLANGLVDDQTEANNDTFPEQEDKRSGKPIPGQRDPADLTRKANREQALKELYRGDCESEP